MVQLFKQSHTQYYWLHEKGMTHTMVDLQDLHSSYTLKHSHISADVGLKLFCLWCLKLGRNTETIAIHLCKMNYQMVMLCDI